TAKSPKNNAIMTIHAARMPYIPFCPRWCLIQHASGSRCQMSPKKFPQKAADLYVSQYQQASTWLHSVSRIFFPVAGELPSRNHTWNDCNCRRPATRSQQVARWFKTRSGDRQTTASAHLFLISRESIKAKWGDAWAQRW